MNKITIKTTRVLCRSRSTLKNFSTLVLVKNNNKNYGNKDIGRILDYQKWRKSKLEKDASYFKNMDKGQQLEYLLIGCSDSRVGAQEIMGLDQGEMFVHRNIANVFVPSDTNLLSVLFY